MQTTGTVPCRSVHPVGIAVCFAVAGTADEAVLKACNRYEEDGDDASGFIARCIHCNTSEGRGLCERAVREALAA